MAVAFVVDPESIVEKMLRADRKNLIETGRIMTRTPA